MSDAHANYYVPEPSHYPVTLTISIFLMFVGGATLLNGGSLGPAILGLGTIGFVMVLFGWFGAVIRESESGVYKEQEDISFRHGNDVVHLFRSHVLRRFLRRALLRKNLLGAVDWRRGYRRGYQSISVAGFRRDLAAASGTVGLRV